MSKPENTEPGGPEPYVSKVDRRAAMTWMGAAVVAAGVGGGALAVYGRKSHADTPVAKGYGTDPNMRNPVAPWPRLLTPAELQTAALLCDFVLPASPDAPSASAIGVPDFINEWVSAPYPDQAADLPVVRGGLKWVEDHAQRRFGKDLFHAAPADRAALLQTLTVKSTDPAMQEPHAFFRRFRGLVIGAYYTTEVGFKDIGYIGNVARASDPGPSLEVKAALEAALKKMRL